MAKIVKTLIRHRILIFSALLVALMLFLFILIPSDDLPLSAGAEETIYYADNISRAHEVIIERFNEINEGRYRVVPINLPFERFSTNERKELLARTLRSKSDRIDLFTVDVIWVPRFAKWCQPLDHYFPPAKQDCILEHVLTSCYYDSHLVAVPLYTDIALMYYRKDLLSRLPDADAIEKRILDSITWEELQSLHRRLKGMGEHDPFYIFPADNFEGLTCSFMEGVIGLGGTLWDGQRIHLKTPQAKKSLQTLTDLVQRYRMTPSVVSKFDEYEGNVFGINQDAMFMRGWPGFIKQHHEAVENPEKLQYLGLAALPHFRQGKKAFVFGGWNFMISRFSTKQEGALAFINFALKEENQKILFRDSGYIPVVESVYQDEAFMKSHSNLDYYRYLIKHGVHRPQMEDYTMISDVLSYYIHLAIEGDMDVEQALNEADRQIYDRNVVIK